MSKEYPLGRESSATNPFYSPRVVPSLYFTSVVEIVAGDRHCLARTHYDRLFAWGKNSHGQLGLGHKEWKETPTEIMHSRGYHFFFSKFFLLALFLGQQTHTHTHTHTINNETNTMKKEGIDAIKCWH